MSWIPRNEEDGGHHHGKGEKECHKSIVEFGTYLDMCRWTCFTKPVRLFNFYTQSLQHKVDEVSRYWRCSRNYILQTRKVELIHDRRLRQMKDNRWSYIGVGYLMVLDY